MLLSVFWRWETAMTNTIAEGGINSDVREVTMTAPEKEKTVAEMTGTRGEHFTHLFYSGVV